MSANKTAASQLIRGDAVADDEWTLVTLPAVEEKVRKQAGKIVQFRLTGEQTHTAEQIAAVTIPETGKVLLPLAVWLLHQQELAAREDAVGVWLSTHEPLESLISATSDINQLPIIAVHIERFADGRALTMGNLLRIRHGYQNELRACGDVLRDQLFFLKRCGYDSYQIRADRSASEALASLRDFSQTYQGAADERQPIWRRLQRRV